MAKLLITATHGYDNSTRAAMPFFVAKGAKEAGIDVGLALALDATVLVKPELRKHVQPYGQPPRENLGLLARMYHDHFKILQESGLEPKATQKVKVEQPAQVSHEVFHFLRPEEALRLKRVEDEIAAGRLDVLDLYREASGIFKAEQEAADRHLIVRRDVGL